jgi:Kef-type K+ transport system membrane component KefB
MDWLSNIAEHPFHEFAIILFLAATLGALGQLLRQPLIVMFIALGIIVGPAGLQVVKSQHQIELLSELGIAVLLFIVGLKLDLRLINSIGRVALLTGIGQVLFTSIIGYAIGLLLGFSHLQSFYIAVALTFSSTIIIVKLLSDKKEIDSLHGQIAIGFLIVQDIVVILVMIVLSAMGRNEESALLDDIVRTMLASVLLVALTYVMMRWVIPRLSHFLARSQELLALFAIAWAVSLAALSELIGFSGEVGAFLAGVSLASSPFKESISSRLLSVRDFLLLFFFVNLGSSLNLSVIGSQLPAATVFSLFVLIGNPIVVLVIMGAMGYRKRTAFLAGLTVAQISEFSLIFAGLGMQVGHLSEEIVGLITLVGLITIGLSTYLILYSHQIYNWLAPALGVFERSNPYREIDLEQAKGFFFDVVIFGVGRFGRAIADKLDQHEDVRYLGVDFDPQVVKEWREQGKAIAFGDIEDPDILEHLPLHTAKCALITVPDVQQSVQLLKCLHRYQFRGEIHAVAMSDSDAEILVRQGVSNPLFPHKMAASNFYNSILSKLLARA